MRKKNILQLSFSPETTWGYPILNCFSTEMKALYKNGFAREEMLSITQKMELFSYIIPRLNKQLENMRAFLKEGSEGIKECLDNGYAYSEIEDELRIAFMSYLDSAIFESDSLCELLEKFSKEVVCKILMEKSFCLKCEVAKKNFDMEWRKDLRRLRNDWIHNYHGWLAFEVKENSFNPVIEVPGKVRAKIFKKDKDVNIILVNEIFDGVNKYLGIIQDILVEKIRASKK